MTDEFTELVGAYVLNALAEDETARVEAHLAECERCARLAEELSSVAGRLERNLPPSRLWSKIAASIDRRHPVEEEGRENPDRE